MAAYAGIDLHSTNSCVAVVNGGDKKVYKRKLPNDVSVVLSGLEPYRRDVEGIVIESTVNWFWIVDLLMEFWVH